MLPSNGTPARKDEEEHMMENTDKKKLDKIGEIRRN